MKKRVFAGLLCLTMGLAGCQGREAALSSSEQSVSVSQADHVSSARESIAVIDSVELPPEPSSAESAPPEFPAPKLSETEQSLLNNCLSVFVRHLDGKVFEEAAQLSKDTVLSVCLSDIEMTKELTAQLFETDDENRDLIPEALVTDAAYRLFGIEGFVHGESGMYDGEKKTYAVDGAALKAPVEFTLKEILGGPEDTALFSVDTNQGAFIYKGYILRLNGMPYFQIISVTAQG